MSHPNRKFAAWAIAALLLTLRATADEATPESATPPAEKPALKATLRGGETVGAHQVQRAFLEYGTNQMAFIVPAGFWMDASNPQNIVLTKADKTCFITVRVGGQSLESGFKELALSRFPGAKITDESVDMVANHSGPSFNLGWNTGGVAQAAHISFITTKAGVIEFTVLSRSSEFKEARNYLDTVLSSVQNNEGGKLVIVPLPNFS